MAKPTKMDRMLAFVRAELEAGRPVPTRRAVAEHVAGHPLSHVPDLGGRYTYKLQKIKMEYGVATPQDIRALESKISTYDPVARLQRDIVRELRMEGLF